MFKLYINLVNYTLKNGLNFNSKEKQLVYLFLFHICLLNKYLNLNNVSHKVSIINAYAEKSKS